MRGGRFQAKTNEDTNTRNAEALFEAKTVGEIREVEVQTRKEIEEKKEELRQLVGASYRDLIESADSILLMKQSCEAVADNIREMESGFASLKKSISFNVSTPAADRERKRREKLYELGSRVKYLVDTPEKIWGCLDEHMYLEGAERYLRAREVHSLLTEIGAKEELLTNFPLLRQQWPLIDTFRAQISQRSKDRLQEPGLRVGDYAVALAANGIIDELNSSDIFSLFLDSRRTWLRTHLRNLVQEKRNPGGLLNNVDSAEADADAAGMADALCKLVHMIQASLCQVGVLFLEVSTGKMPLMYSTVLAAPPGSQLFGGIPNPDQEVRLWKAHREKLEGSMVSLSGAFITDACLKWLEDCAKEIAVEARPLIEQIRTGHDLAKVEGLVREDLKKQEALDETLDWLQDTFGSGIDSPWECLCDLLLKAPRNLWDTLFEGLFVSRMKIVVKSGFAAINMKQLVDDCIEATSSPSSAGGDEEQVSTLVQGDNYGGAHPLRELDANRGSGNYSWRSNSSEKEWAGDAKFFFTPEVAKVKDKVDNSLKVILQDLVSFLQGPHGQMRTDLLAPYLHEQCFKWVSTVAKGLESRLTKLSESMLRAAADILNMSPENLKHSPGGTPERSGKRAGLGGHASRTRILDVWNPSKVVEQALSLGRLSAALGQHSVSLPLLFGSPTSWTAKETPIGQGTAKSSTPIGHRPSWSDANYSSFESPGKWFSRRGSGGLGSPAADDGAVKLRELQRNLRRQSIAAHQMWVRWSTEGLAGTLLRDLHKDEGLSTSTPLKGWEETMIKSRVEEGEEVEARMSLPAMPSPYALAFLFAGCREIHRVGGHVLDRAVLELFAWQLLEKVLTVYEKFVSDPSFMNSRVSEKGLLQLLFDLKYLSDVLSGGQDISIENLDAAVDEKLVDTSPLNSIGRLKQPTLKADAGRKKWVNSLLYKLHSRLDPIDWAMYETYLWEHEQRYYQRCAVLFGSLTQLHRLHTDKSLKLPSTADTNTLNMSATVPRFTYLPISAPIFSVKGVSPLRYRRKLLPGDSNAGWKAFTNGDEASKFSFTESPSQTSVASAKPLLQSLMGQMGQVGSKFGEGTFKLGSMLSDGQVGRFKDKSAAAISTFGDMLPVQAAGLFSSLTASASKQDSQDRMYYS